MTLLKIKSSLHLRYYAEACNEWQRPSTRFSAWATQLRIKRRSGGDLTSLGLEPRPSALIALSLTTA